MFNPNRPSQGMTKGEILNNAMYANQPQIDDFRGAKGYSDWMLERDKMALQKKLDDIARKEAKYGKSESSNDKYSKYLEPLLTFMMNTEAFFPKKIPGFLTSRDRV